MFVVSSVYKGCFLFRMLKLVLLVSCCVAAVSCSEISTELATKLHNYNLMCHCWGDNMVEAFYAKQKAAIMKCGGSIVDPKEEADTEVADDNAVEAGTEEADTDRTARGAMTKEYRKMFLGQLADYKTEMYSKTANLTCVLKELEQMTEDGKINIDYWSVENLTAKYSTTPAGSDPLFIKKFSEEINGCYELSMNYPKSSLNKNSFMKKFGQQYIFLGCEKKVKQTMCMKFMLKEHCEKTYGAVEIIDGMDIYDSAAMEVKVMHEQATPEAKFIDEHFWGKPTM